MSPKSAPTIHGTAVSWLDKGLLIEGPSGTGKSQLALALMAEAVPASLIADDRVIINRVGNKLVLSCPSQIQGLIERYGWGIESHPFVKSSQLDLVVSLVQNSELERMPEPKELTWRYDSLKIPRLLLPGQPVNGPASIRAILARI